MTLGEMESKFCKGCEATKPVVDFAKHGATKDRLAYRCRACISQKNREQYARNPERKLDAANARYSAKGEEIRAKNSAYRAANGERVKGIRERSKDKNRASLNAKNAVYRATFPEKVRAAAQNARARRKGAPGSHTHEDIRALMRLQRGLCIACRADIRARYHVDHVLPIARGGSHARENIQLLCPTCNLRKNARHPVDFMQSRGFLL